MTAIAQHILAGVGAILVLATLVPFVRTDAWWARLFDFPRLQIAVLIVAVLPGLILLGGLGDPRQPILIGLLAASLGWQSYRIFPFTWLAPVQVRDAKVCLAERRFRLMIANVLMENRDAPALLALMHAESPDVLLVAEADEWWDQQLAAGLKTYRFAVRHPLSNTYGMLLFSRLPLKDVHVRHLVEPDVPSIHAQVCLRSGELIDFYGVHPRPPTPGQDSAERDAELIIVGKMAKKSGRPSIIAGDLNDVAWSHTTRLFQRVSAMLDPRIGRGFFATFNANWLFLRWPLDHVFHDATFTLCEIRRLPYIGSDHFPMLIELCHVPKAAATQEPPPPAPGDAEDARDHVRAGLQTR